MATLPMFGAPPGSDSNPGAVSAVPFGAPPSGPAASAMPMFGAPPGGPPPRPLPPMATLSPLVNAAAPPSPPDGRAQLSGMPTFSVPMNGPPNATPPAGQPPTPPAPSPSGGFKGSSLARIFGSANDHKAPAQEGQQSVGAAEHSAQASDATEDDAPEQNGHAYAAQTTPSLARPPSALAMSNVTVPPSLHTGLARGLAIRQPQSLSLLTTPQPLPSEESQPQQQPQLLPPQPPAQQLPPQPPAQQLPPLQAQSQIQPPAAHTAAQPDQQQSTTGPARAPSFFHRLTEESGRPSEISMSSRATEIARASSARSLVTETKPLSEPSNAITPAPQPSEETKPAAELGRESELTLSSPVDVSVAKGRPIRKRGATRPPTTVKGNPVPVRFIPQPDADKDASSAGALATRRPTVKQAPQPVEPVIEFPASVIEDIPNTVEWLVPATFLQAEYEWTSVRLIVTPSRVMIYDLKGMQQIGFEIMQLRVRRAPVYGEACFGLEEGQQSAVLKAPSAGIASKWLERLLTMVTETQQLQRNAEEPMLRGASDSETEGEEDIVELFNEPPMADDDDEANSDDGKDNEQLLLSARQTADGEQSDNVEMKPDVLSYQHEVRSSPRMRQGKQQSHTQSLLQSTPRYDRHELVKTHVLRPKLSIRRVNHLLSWLNSLGLSPTRIDIRTLHVDFSNGIVLCKLMQHLVPGVEYPGLNPRPLAKRAAIENVERALSVIWRSKTINTTRIPKAADIFTGRTGLIVGMLQEVFEVYVMKPLRKKAPQCLRWMRSVLQQYKRPFLNDEEIDELKLHRLWNLVQNGTAIFCILYQFFGPIRVGDGADTVRIDSLRIKARPKNLQEFRDNVQYVFQILKALNIDVLWRVDDWLNNADEDFVLLQLFLIYMALKDRQCPLPPAHGSFPGTTSGPNGELLVVGVLFGDSEVDRLESYYRRKRAVLLGEGSNCMSIPDVYLDGVITAPTLAPGLTCRSAPPLAELDGYKFLFDEEVNEFDAQPIGTVAREQQTMKTVTEDAPDRERHRVFAALERTYVRSASPQTRQIAHSWARVREGMAYSKEANEELRAAEEEAEAAELELDRLEDALEQRYIELEQGVGSLANEAYESILQELEVEQQRLQRQRERVQAEFRARCMSVEAPHSARSPVRDTFTSPKTRTRRNWNQPDTKELEELEKGWLANTRNASSYNTAIQKSSAVATEKKQLRNTPKHMRDPTMGRMSKKDAGMLLNDAWFDFVAFVREEQERWVSSMEMYLTFKIKDLERDLEAANSQRVLTTGNKIQEVQQAIRSEETRLMTREEWKWCKALLERARSLRVPGDGDTAADDAADDLELHQTHPPMHKLPPQQMMDPQLDRMRGSDPEPISRQPSVNRGDIFRSDESLSGTHSFSSRRLGTDRTVASRIYPNRSTSDRGGSAYPSGNSVR